MAETKTETAAKKPAAKKTAKKTAVKKPAAKKTAAKKPAAKKTAAKKPAAKKVEAKVVEENITLRARVEELRAQAEERLSDVRENVEDVVAEVREISLDNFRALDRETLKGYADEAQAAFKAAGEAAVTGIREINGEVLSIVEGNVNAGFANARALLAAESLEAAVEIQREFVRSQIETYVEQAKKVAELSVSKSEAVAQPVSSNAKAAWTKFKQAA